MRRFFKILGLTLAILFSVLLVIAVILMSPPVQTALAHKAIAALEERIDGRLTFEKLSVRPFDAIVVENAALIDNHPYYSPSHPAMTAADTVASAKYISAVFSIWSFLKGDAALLSDLVVKDGRFCLVNEPGTSNIKRIFGKDKKKKGPKTEIPDRPFLKASRLNIEGFRFRLMNFRNPKPDRDRAINWTNLDARDIYLKAHDVSLTGIITEGTVDHLEAKERSGYVINHISGKARVYNMETKVENLVIRDMWSDLHLPLFKMAPDKGESSLGPFLEEVKIGARISRSRLNMESIAYFAPTLHKMNIVAIIEESDVSGYINDLTVKGFRFRTPENDVCGEIDGTITGLPSSIAMLTNYDVKHLEFTSKGIDRFIRGWAPGMDFDMSRFGHGEKFSFTGSIRGPLNKADISGTLRPSSGGSLQTKLSFRNLIEGEGKPIGINGRVSTENFNLGRLLAIDALGGCTMHAGFQTDISSDVSIRIDSLKIDRLHALGYDYKGLLAAGTYSGNAFNGTLFCNDPNLNFMFNGLFTFSNKSGGGAYKFTASVLHADLHALNIDSRETSRMSFRTDADFKTLKGGDILGSIKFSDVLLTDSGGRHDIGSIYIDSYTREGTHRINLSSKIAGMSFSGTGFIDSFIKDLASLSAGRELPALYADSPQPWSGNTYNISFKTMETANLLSFIKPGLYIAGNSTLGISIDASGKLEGRLKSQRLAFRDKYIKDAELNFSNADGYLGGELNAEEIKVAPLRTLGNRLLIYAEDNNLGLGFSYDNQTEPSNKGEVYIRGELKRESHDDVCLMANILPSSISLAGETWKIGSTPVRICSRSLSTDALTIENNGQKISILGGISSSRKDTLRIQLDNFDVSVAEDFIAGGLGIKGIANGAVLIPSPSSDGLPPILANLRIDGVHIADEPLGTIKIGSAWDPSLKAYKAICRNDLDGKRNIDFWGYYSPSNKKVKGDLHLDSMNLSCLSPLLTSVFSDVGGYLSGDLHLGGSTKAIELSSNGINIREGLVRIGYTNVPYNIEGTLDVNSYGAFFSDITVKDRNDSRGKLTGGLRWNRLRDLYLDMAVAMENMEAIDLPEDSSLPFYGHIKASGEVKITGPFNALLLEVDASTSGNGELRIPTDGSQSAGRSDLLTFKEAVSLDHIDPYEALISAWQREEKKTSRFGAHLNIKAHPGVEATIEIDKDAGNIISGRGDGNIEININPVDGRFTMGGDYNITDGIYHFVALGIAKRDFNIQQGSQVKFNGDIMETDLNINALYRTKTSLSTLLADTTSTSSRRLVECGIHITDRLRHPRLAFSIDVPDIDPTTKARVESAINTEDKLQKQFLSLLISGGFLPDERSSIVNNSAMLGSTVTEMMASQLSNILQKLNIPIDLGLDYQQNSGGADIFDVAVSTQLFNNRIVVNGSIGNRQYGTTSSQEVVGDFDVEIKIDRAGTLRGSVFLHSADQYTNYLDNLQRSGVGIAYQREFDTFRELLRSIFPFAFKSKAAKPELPAVKPKRIIIIEE